MLAGIIMRRVIIPLIVITLAFAVSCSPSVTVEKLDILPASGESSISSTEFSADLFVVEVTYSNGSTKILDGEGIVSPEYDTEDDASRTWNGMVEASYGGKTAQKTFILGTVIVPFPPNGVDNTNTYKQMVSLTIYQTKLATDGEKFDPSYFEIRAEYADGFVEVLDGEGFVELRKPDDTMDKGDYVIASIRGYKVLLAIDFID